MIQYPTGNNPSKNTTINLFIVWQRKKVMSITQVIQKQIKEIEARIKTDSGDVEELKRVLSRLKMQEFEEDIKESDNRQLLQG
jgi:TolA-binding protein